MGNKIIGLLKSMALGVIAILILAAIFGGNSSDKKDSGSNNEQPAAEASATATNEKSEDKGSEKKETKKSDSTKQEAKKQEAKKEEAKKEEATTDDGPKIAENAKYKVDIKDCSIVENYDGSPCIAIDYTFTNVSDKSPSSMQMSTNITVYQDGVECEDAYFADANSDDGYSNKVKAGVSVDVTRAYKLQNTTSDVEVEVAPLWSFNDDLLAYKTFKLS